MPGDKDIEYRLLKDLSQVMSGTIFVREVTVCDDVYKPDEHRVVYKNRNIKSPVFCTTEMEDLVREGWFEEASTPSWPTTYKVNFLTK